MVTAPSIPLPWAIRLALKFDIQMISSFKCSDSDSNETIHAIAPISDREAWVCCGWGSNQIHLYTIDGKKKNTVTLDFQIDDMCVGPRGEVLVTSYEDTYVKTLDKALKVDDFSVMYLYPAGLALTADRKEVLVCAVDSYVSTRGAKSKRAVLRMSAGGNTIDEIEEEEERSIFGAPYRVAGNINGDICVTDREEGNVRVTVLEQNGKVKHTYSGPPEGIPGRRSFNPLGIVCDDQGYIIVTDWSNHSVHLLDSSCEFQGFLLTEKDGIFGPNALALDKSGYLWVGDSKANVKVYKYSPRKEL